MAKKIRFPLEMDNEVEVRTLEELKTNFSMERVIGYYENGKLTHWLDAQNLSEMAENIKNLRSDGPDFYEELCRILGIEYDEYMKAAEKKEKDFLENIHVCHCFSKIESDKSKKAKTTTTYGIYLKDTKTGEVTETVSFSEGELINDRLGEKIWYERHGQWILYLKTNTAEKNAAPTYSFYSYDLLSHKEKLICGQLPESETSHHGICLHVYKVNRQHILWQWNDTLYLTEHNKQMQIYSTPQPPEQDALCLHPDLRGINYRINSAMTSRGILFTVKNAVNPIEKTLHYYSFSTSDTTQLATGCSINAPIETNDKLFFSKDGTLFFVDEEKTEIHEICPLRDHAEPSDRLETIQENEDYIVWIIKKKSENGKTIKFLECYAKQDKSRNELEQFEGGFTKESIPSQSGISLTSDKISYTEFVTNYAGEIFAEKEKSIGYDGNGDTKWVSTMENWEWTSVDAGSDSRSITTLVSSDELPFSLSGYLSKRQDMLAAMEEMREKIKLDGVLVR